MRRSASTITRCEARAAFDHLGQFRDALVQHGIAYAQRGYLVSERPIRAANGCERQAPLDLIGSKPGVVGEHLGQDIRRHLVNLVDDAHYRGDVRRADAAIKAFDQLSIVDLHA
jgi:hypothetical protein